MRCSLSELWQLGNAKNGISPVFRIPEFTLEAGFLLFDVQSRAECQERYALDADVHRKQSSRFRFSLEQFFTHVFASRRDVQRGAVRSSNRAA